MDQVVIDTRVELLRMNIEPRWSDMDALAHVNSLESLGYMQECRVKWLLEMNVSFNETAPVLVNLHGEFKAELNYPTSIEVVMYGKEPGRSSLLTEYEVWSKGENSNDTLCVSGYAKMVWIDVNTRRPVNLPDCIKTIFK